jgi:crotonobetainyl-CoA:carnitine CoA-transferase CaiB-like acyl-CoA transferase
MWHRGKKSVTLDLKTPGGRESLHQLVSGSDVLLHTFRPGVAGRLGAGYDSLKQLNPALVYCAISGFGPLECYQDIKGYDGIAAALTGRFHAFDNQIEKDGPIFTALPVASFGAAMLALQGTMAALYSREGTGWGQKVETSLLQALAIYNWDWLIWQFKQWGRDPNVGLPRTEPTPQYFVARTKDGRWLQMANAMNYLFVNWLVGIGLDDVLEDPRYIHLPFVEDKWAEDELYRRMFSQMEEKDLDEWMHLFMTDVDAASEGFGHTPEAFNHPQVVHNGHAIALHDPQVGPSLQLGPLAMFTETPLKPRGPSPALGQQNAEILGRIKEKKAPRPKPSHHPMPKAPLYGVTILEFASWVAVPLGPSMLADMGARVIKVEPPGGDPWRGFGAMGLRTLQGKESVALDLKKPEGQRIAGELIKRADIVAHNFRPGVPERLDITYETARALNPGIIYLYGAGYGSTGPYSHRSVMHPVPGAVAGGALYQAGRGTPPAPDAELTYEEVRRIAQALSIANEGNPEVTSAMVVASSLLMALYVRKKTGKGQYLETSMICSNLYANSDDFSSTRTNPRGFSPTPS